MSNNVKWLDFKSLERASDDKDFDLFSFIIFGSRFVSKRWWWLFIPLLNLYICFFILLAVITFPLRLYINSSQLRRLIKNVYDIEDTNSPFRLIRNRRGDIGLCKWGKSYEFSRKVLLEPQYIDIARWRDDGFIITDKNYKMGLYDPIKEKWTFPCECRKIEIESKCIINVTKNNISQRYNNYGERILN